MVPYGHADRMAMPRQRVGQQLVFGRHTLLHQLPRPVRVVDAVQCGVDRPREGDSRVGSPFLVRIGKVQVGNGRRQQSCRREGSQLTDGLVTFGHGGRDRIPKRLAPPVGRTPLFAHDLFVSAHLLFAGVSLIQVRGDRGEFSVEFIDSRARGLDKDAVGLRHDFGFGASVDGRFPRFPVVFGSGQQFVFGLDRVRAGPSQCPRRGPKPGQGDPVVTKGRANSGQFFEIRWQTDITGEFDDPSASLLGLVGALAGNHDGFTEADVDPAFGLVFAGEFDMSVAEIVVLRLSTVFGGEGGSLGDQAGFGFCHRGETLIQ